MYFLRSIIDRAVLDVLASNHKEERGEALEWFCTSAYDQLCNDAGMEPGYTFLIMQGVFDCYKNSPYGENWNKPNVHPIRTSIG
jgi:hypothetical protein